MNPLVSILVPLYNAERWVAQTLESAINQTWRNTEIVVVDDGSTDKSCSIAKSFTSSKVKVIQQENRGCGAARNRAYREAQGEFIQYLDADDLIAADKIERQILLFQQHGSLDCVASGEWARFFEEPDKAEFKPEAVWRTMSPTDWLVSSWMGGGMMHPAAWLFPRLLCDQTGSFDEAPCPDAEGEYVTRLLLNSKAVLFCKGARSFYRSGIPSSLSAARKPEMLSALYRSLELSANHLLVAEDSPRTRKACATLLQRFIFATYPSLPHLIQKAEVRVQQLGGSDLTPGGGPIFQFLRSTLGWKSAKHIQQFVHWQRSKYARYLISPSTEGSVCEGHRKPC